MNQSLTDPANKPLLSVLLIGYRMPKALANTLRSFSPGYQHGVRADDYELVIVENRSEACLDDRALDAGPGNFRYFLRENDSVSPVSAIEFGLGECRGKHVGIVIDGAQMVTPGVVRLVLEIFREEPNALIAVPGYHLGEREQHMVDDNAALDQRQDEFLASSGWQEDGYRLFRWACFSPSNRRGFRQPMMECNAFFCSREMFDRAGPVDQRFQYPGGGSINLHMYRTLGLQREARLFVLPGEGTFHQYHGGVTTRNSKEMAAQLETFNAQLQEIWNHEFAALRRKPEYRGEVGEFARRFDEQSKNFAERRRLHAEHLGRPLWPDDLPENQLGQGREADT